MDISIVEGINKKKIKLSYTKTNSLALIGNYRGILV